MRLGPPMAAPYIQSICWECWVSTHQATWLNQSGDFPSVYILFSVQTPDGPPLEFNEFLYITETLLCIKFYV